MRTCYSATDFSVLRITNGIGEYLDLLTGPFKVFKGLELSYSNAGAKYGTEGALYQVATEMLSETVLSFTGTVLAGSEADVFEFLCSEQVYRVDFVVNGFAYYCYVNQGSVSHVLNDNNSRTSIKSNHVMRGLFLQDPGFIKLTGDYENETSSKYDSGKYEAGTYSGSSRGDVGTYHFEYEGHVDGYLIVEGEGLNSPVAIYVNDSILKYDGSVPIDSKFEYSNVPLNNYVRVNGISRVQDLDPSKPAFELRLSRGSNYITVVGLSNINIKPIIVRRII